jgi:hypothetical protein
MTHAGASRPVKVLAHRVAGHFNDLTLKSIGVSLTIKGHKTLEGRNAIPHTGKILA